MKIGMKVNQAGAMLHSPMDLVVRSRHSVDRARDEPFRLGTPHPGDVFLQDVRLLRLLRLLRGLRQRVWSLCCHDEPVEWFQLVLILSIMRATSGAWLESIP